MTENQKSWVFAVALAMVFVLVSCVSVASAYDFGPDVVGADIYIPVPYGYFDNPVSYYSGSTDVGGVSVSWDDSGYVTLTSDSTSRYYGCGFGPYASSISVDDLIWRAATGTLPNPISLSNLLYNNPRFYAGYGDFAFFVMETRNSDTFYNYYGNHIVISDPTPPTVTVTPTATPVQPPHISTFTVMPTYAYPYVSLNVTLVGDGGTSAYITRSDVSPNVDLSLQAGTTDTWVGQISFAAPGDYEVQGFLVGPGGTSSTAVVNIHIFELPQTPVISSWSVDYDQGYDVARLTATVVYPAGAVVHPDTAFWVDWGDGQSVDYYYFDPPPSYDTPVTVQMSHQYADFGTYSASFTAQNADGNTSQVFGVHIADPGPTPTPTATTPTPTATTPIPTATTPTPTATTPTPTATTPAPTGTYPTPTYTIPTPITTVVIPTYVLDAQNPLGLGIASPGGEPPAPPAFPALVLPNLNILEGWGQNTSWSGLYTWYDGIVGSIVDPLGIAWVELMAPVVQYVVDVSAGVTSLFLAVSTWIYPAVAFVWDISAYIYALVPLVVWICIAAMLWILVLALLVRLLSEPVWMIIRDLFGGRR